MAETPGPSPEEMGIYNADGSANLRKAEQDLAPKAEIEKENDRSGRPAMSRRHFLGIAGSLATVFGIGVAAKNPDKINQVADVAQDLMRPEQPQDTKKQSAENTAAQAAIDEKEKAKKALTGQPLTESEVLEAGEKGE